MGKKSANQDMGLGSVKKQEELLKTLGDFTSKENWDKFFTLRGIDDSFEWYAEWPELKNLLTTHLLLLSSKLESDEASKELSILIPGCGNSTLSEQLYDEGYTNIINIDFSKVVISNMLRRNVRDRPKMKWRTMDMTNMQFENESFDAIVDKGGLDALMEPELGSKLGNLYLSEVKRLLKDGGKFICLTLAESHVLDLLFQKFRFGWKMSLYVIAREPSTGNHNLQTFAVITENDQSTNLFEITSFIHQSSTVSCSNQVSGLSEALEREKSFRSEYLNVSDIVYSMKDLKLGEKGNLAELCPGRRVKLTLGEPGVSYLFYKAVLLDAKEDSGSFVYPYGVFLVPRSRSHEWLFSSVEGQWLVVSSSKAARLLMVVLDSSQAGFSPQDIQMDLSPLVKQLSPGNSDGLQIPFMAASDGITQRKIVHEVMSALTGSIVVEDIICDKLDNELSRRFSPKDLIFRRLTFQRSESLVQSEAILSTPSEVDDVKSVEASETGKKGKQRKSDLIKSGSFASGRNMNVNHNYLASSYHNGIISGFMLISTHLENVSIGSTVKVVVIGLGAGLLPMFLRNCLPFLDIEVVELDPMVLDIAREYFGFMEDERMKVRIADGIKFVREIEYSGVVEVATICSDEFKEKVSCKTDILIIDVDSADSITGLTCPGEDFVEESFLLTAKNSLSEQGLFIINLVSRSLDVKKPVYSSLKKLFVNLYSLQLEEDVNEVIFALKTDTPVEEDKFADSFSVLARLLNLEKQEWSQRIINASKLIKRLR